MSLQKFTCPHTGHTKNDGEGWAICLKCGAAIRIVLSKRMIDNAIEAERKKR